MRSKHLAMLLGAALVLASGAVAHAQSKPSVMVAVYQPKR